MTTPPLRQVNTMAPDKYFAYGLELMKLNPPHVTNWSTLARLERIGLEPGKSFDASKLDAGVRVVLDRGAANALKLMPEKMPTLARVTNGWQMNTDTMSVHGNYYLKRAIVALVIGGARLHEWIAKGV